MTSTRDLCSSRRILRLAADPRVGWLPVDTRPGTTKKLVAALRQSSKDCLWLLPNEVTVSRLLDAISELYRQEGQPKRALGRLLALQSKPGAAPVLRGLFEPVVGLGSTFRHLADDELLEVLSLPREQAQDLIIGGLAHLASEFLVLVRGDLSTLVTPFASFAPSADAKPDFRKLAFDDHGHTVRLGRYEAATDAILYDLDPDYRSRLNRRRRDSDRGFGPALRRLRKQRGLSRADFPGLSEKTLARIERGECDKPRERTLAMLEKRLGMSRDEIETY